jgi:peptide/nickel transport system substrate-binding protein
MSKSNSNKISAKLEWKFLLNQLAFGVLIDKMEGSMDWEAVLMGFGRGQSVGSNIWLTDAQSHHFNRKPSAEPPQLEGRMVSEWEKKIEGFICYGFSGNG